MCAIKQLLLLLKFDRFISSYAIFFFNLLNQNIWSSSEVYAVHLTRIKSIGNWDLMHLQLCFLVRKVSRKTSCKKKGC